MLNKWIKANFSSDKICEGVDEIDYQGLYDEGIRLILLDIDNTLAVHGSSQADDYAIAAVDKMRSANLMVVILSNARRQRAKAFAGSLQLEAEGMAGKPSPKALLRVCDRHAIDRTAACMIGDQLLTDIWAAKRAGVKSILVRPRSEEEGIHIRLKRRIENKILSIVGMRGFYR